MIRFSADRVTSWPSPGASRRARRCASPRDSQWAAIVAVLVLLVAPGTVAARQASAGQTTVPPDFDAYVARVLDTFDVPGVSVAIVKDGKVLLAKGFGVKDLGTGEPVDGHTLFGIASATLIASAAQWPILISPSVIALALGAAAATGIVFGFFPARRAASFNPIDALRSE